MPQKALISVKNASKSFWSDFKTSHILKNISLEVPQGAVYGFLGPNGAGKTTTMKLLVGLLKPDEGEVLINGLSPLDSSIKEITGFLPENPYFYNYLTGKEFLTLCGQLCGLSNKKLQSNITKILALVKMKDHQHKFLSTYSKGMLQRIGIAQCLIHDPQIIFLDEPLSGLDPIGRKEIKDILLSLKKKKKTIFLSSHIIHDIEELCDHVGIINKGEVIRQGSIQKLVKGKSLEQYFMKVIQNQNKKMKQ
jgi:ABC-2 type transport system ATP-binding protein